MYNSHIRFHDLFPALREDEVGEQDVQEGFHLDHREPLPNTRLQRPGARVSFRHHGTI